MKKIIAIALLGFTLTCGAESASQIAAVNARLAGIVFQKSSIDSSKIIDESVEPLLQGIVSSSPIFQKYFSRNEYDRAMRIFIAYGKTASPPEMVTDQIREELVKAYIEQFCSI